MKSRIKKILVSIQLFFLGMIPKVFAITTVTDIEPAYGIEIETDYGIEMAPTPIERAFSLGKFILPVILFIIGLFVILSKKITKKVKAIVISILILLGIIGTLLMNFLSDML